MVTEGTQLGASREGVSGEILCRQGEKDLLTVTCSQQARKPIQSCSEIVPIPRCGGSGMEGHSDSQRIERFGPLLLRECPLGIERCSDRIGGRREGGLHCIADYF